MAQNPQIKTVEEHVKRLIEVIKTLKPGFDVRLVPERQQLENIPTKAELAGISQEPIRAQPRDGPSHAELPRIVPVLLGSAPKSEPIPLELEHVMFYSRGRAIESGQSALRPPLITSHPLYNKLYNRIARV